jgi:hypothetical protein
MTTIFTGVWWTLITAFVLTETTALLLEYRSNRQGLTFSELWWRVFRVRDPRPTALTWVLRGGALVGLVWLLGHLGAGWWTL